MSYDFLQIEKKNAAGILRLNRPDALNAFNDRMIQELPVALDSLLQDGEIRVIILTGNGRGFCAGADVNLLKKVIDEKRIAQGKNVVVNGSQLVEKLHKAGKPVIAAINGPTAGGGAGIALACDIRIMAQSATIGFPFATLGLHPDLGCTYFLPRLVGPAKAVELFMTGEMLSANVALQHHLVNEVVADESLMTRALLLAEYISRKSPFAIRLIKKGMSQALQQPLDAILKYEVYAQELCFDSQEASQSVNAFLQKRQKR